MVYLWQSVMALMTALRQHGLMNNERLGSALLKASRAQRPKDFLSFRAGVKLAYVYTDWTSLSKKSVDE
jgi:hypothetical protein